MSLTRNSHPNVTRGSRVSRAPPHHTLPAFLNLHGTRKNPFLKVEHVFFNSDEYIIIEIKW